MAERYDVLDKPINLDITVLFSALHEPQIIDERIWRLNDKDFGPQKLYQRVREELCS